MLSYIYRLIRDFEREHGIHPNLLYLNQAHAMHLQQGLDERLTSRSIRDLLQLELIIDQDIVHPHVAWTQSAQRVAV
jgi:hypothetical protein